MKINTMKINIGRLIFLLFFLFVQTNADDLLFAQENNNNKTTNTVTGTVSADGFTLPGATVKNMTTKVGAVTDENGHYKIVISGPTDILQFSFLGYEHVDRVAGISQIINVTLGDSSTELDEVMVVGYGSQKKRDITGSIVSVGKDDIEKKMPSNVFEALQGNVAGVQITSGSGAPGEGASVVIRGISTMNDAGIGPLWVVDGVPTTDINNINPYDIESMEVLKDAASAAIYGSRSANGVIIITTKKGSDKAPVIEVRYQHSLSQLTHKLPQINSQQYRQMQKSLLEYSNGEGAGLVSTVVRNVLTSQINDSLNYLLNNDNDYQDLAFRIAQKDQLDISFGGGTDRLKYMLTGGYYNEQGIIDNTGLKRISTRINTDFKATSKLNLGTRVNFSFARRDGIDEGGFLNSLLQRKPNLALTYPDETTIGMLWGLNPLAANLQTNFTEIFKTSFSQFIEYQFTKELKFTTSINTNFSLYRNNFMRPTLLSNEYLENYGRHTSTMSYDWMNENYFNYTKRINYDHNITAMLGISLQGWKQEVDYFSGKNSATDAVYTQNAFAAHFDLTNTGTTETAHNMASAYSRFTYNYKSRYLFTANIRADGSSRFAKNKKVGYFPSISAAWRFSDEGYMSWLKQVTVNDAKFRLSYGTTGNESISDYESLLTYSIGGIYDGVSGVTASRIAVSDLGWEQTAQTNAGIDLMFKNSRYKFSVDYYDKTTTNLLANYEIPKEWGFNTVRKNIGSIVNQGLELSFNGDVVKTKNVTFNVNTNVSFNHNKVKKLAQGIPYLYNNKWWISEGRPLGDFYGYTNSGVFQYDQSNAFNNDWEKLTPVFKLDENGSNIIDMNGKYELDYYMLGNTVYSGDVNQKKLSDGTSFRGGDIDWKENAENADGIIDDNDRAVIGNAQPDFTGGLSFNLRIKNWTLFVSTYYSIGGKIYNQARYYRDMVSMESFATLPSHEWLNNFWVKQGDDVMYPRPYGDRFQNNRELSSLYIEDASYIKIQNIRLNYFFNIKDIKHLNITGLRVSAYINNPMSFTNYSGYDPEFSSFSALAIGMDTNRFPRKSELGMGLSVNF